MKAIVVHRLGSPDVLKLEECPVPEPQDGQVLIQLHAVGVNFSDTERRRGVYAAPQLPWRPGSEGAGVVTEVGSGVARNWMGRRVAFWAMPPQVSGTYAEFAVAPEYSLFDLGDDISFEIGASLPLQGLTAYGLAFLSTRLQSGQHVLVHAAAGGIGQMLVQMAHIQGATVLGTASDRKLDVIRGLGATALTYSESLADDVLRATDGRGVDVIFDAIGKPTQAQNFEMLAPFGLLMHYGDAGGAPAPVSPEHLYAKCLKVGSFGLDVSRDPEVWTGARRQLVEWARTGVLSPSVSRRFALAEAAIAHEHLESRKSTGKIILYTSAEVR